MIVITSIKLTKEQFEKIKNLAEELGLDVEEVINFVINEGMKGLKLKIILDLLRKKRITVWKAAEILGISFREMEDIMKEHGIHYPLSMEEISMELKEIEGGK